jgi:hypothetical protein
VNPEFIQLHSVRHDEIGWGYDLNGCLLLHLVYIKNSKLNEDGVASPSKRVQEIPRHCAGLRHDTRWARAAG